MPLFTRLAVAAAALWLAFAPLSAIAQSNDAQLPAETYGDWLLRCAANDATRCALTQRIVNSESRKLVAEVGIAPLANGAEGYALVLSVPEGADLSGGPAFRLDGSEKQAAMAWRVCVNPMCQASASVTPDAAAAMDGAGRAVFGYKKYRANKLTLTPVSFDGLADGLAAMAAK
jgi:invasion protein IalB